MQNNDAFLSLLFVDNIIPNICDFGYNFDIKIKNLHILMS